MKSSIVSRIMWKIKGRGNWTVDNPSTGERFLFERKSKALEYSEKHNLEAPFKRN